MLRWLTKKRLTGTEEEIDRLLAANNLTETDREILRVFYRSGLEAAEKNHRQDKMWAFQRLLRRLLLHQLLHQPLDQPIPLNDRSQETPPEVTVHVAEPSVTQQSPKQGDTARKVRTALVAPRMFRYVLSSIGATALVWAVFPFRLPTYFRDAVVPVHDNQQDIARAPAVQDDKFKQVAHAGAPTPSAAIEPGAEGASATVVLPIYQTVRRILLREEPRFGAPAQIMLDRGTKLIVLEINGPWYEVVMETTGATGFVREEWVVPADTAGPTSTINAKGES